MLKHRAPRATPIVGALAMAGRSTGAAFNVQRMHLAKYTGPIADAPEGTGTGSEWLVPPRLVLTYWLILRTKVAPFWVAALFAPGGVHFVTGRARIDTIAYLSPRNRLPRRPQPRVGDIGLTEAGY